MSIDPRIALAALVTALERHLEASLARHGEEDPAVAAAYDRLVDAFEDYDNALYDATGEVTPFDIEDEDDEDDDGDEEDDSDELDEDDSDELDDPVDDEDEDQIYAGLDDADIDDSSR